jgi:hypothetical protein
VAISYTYDSLVTALQNWAEDSFADYVTELPDIIGKAETQCLRDLDLEMFAATDTSLSTIAANPILPLPAGTIVLRNLWLGSQPVLPRSESFVEQYRLDTSEERPLYWCQNAETSVALAPTPDTIYPARMRVTLRPAALSPTLQSTWLSTHAGDLLFAAALTLTEIFDKSPPDQAVAEASYQATLARAREELSMLRRTDYPR